MPLENILSVMQSHAEDEIARVTRAAEEEAAQLVSEAEAQAVAIQARHRARVEPAMAAQAASLQNRAKLAALRAVADAREQLLVETFAAAEERFGRIRASDGYPALFEALAREALAALGEEGPGDAASESGGDPPPRFTARVDPKDADLARKTFEALGAGVKLEMQPTPLGGVALAMSDGRVVVVNTLAARLARARQGLRGPVAAILVGGFDSEKEWLATTTMPTPA